MNLILMILFLILSIFIKINILKLLFLLISFIFCLKIVLFNINILNEKCDPVLFFEKNKNKKYQTLNCCFAILHMWSEDLNDIFLEYLNKAKEKKIKSNIYKMKLDYLDMYYKILQGITNVELNELQEEYNQEWLKPHFMFMEWKYIKNFNKPKNKCGCILDTVIQHFEKGLELKDINEELANKEFQYVIEYGGTTIYKKQAELYITEKQINKIKPKISLKYKYFQNKNLIDLTFCVYLILFIII